MTNRATHLCECNSVVDLLKHPMVLCVCYDAKFERLSAKRCRRKYRRTPKYGERCNSAHLGWEAWLTPRYTPLPHMSYQVKFGSSATNGVRINRRKLQKLGSAGVGGVAYP